MNIEHVAKSSKAMEASGRRRSASNWGGKVCPAHGDRIIDVQIIEVSCKYMRENSPPLS